MTYFRSRRRLPRALTLAAAAMACSGCMTPARMCASEGDCGEQASCVAGRCVARNATVAIDGARRMLFEPVDVAYLRRGAAQSRPAYGQLGAAGGEDARILLRFAVPLAPEAVVLEAYVVLERAAERYDRVGPIVLGTARIAAPWDGGSVSWATAPRLVDTGAPLTIVAPAAGPIVRLDVRGLVERWRRRRGDDFGVAVGVEGKSAASISFVLAPAEPSFATRTATSPALGSPRSAPEPRSSSAWPAADPRREATGPRLELYLK